MTKKVCVLAIDLAKGSFQVCAVGTDGAVPFSRVLSRTRLTALLAEQAACIVAMEACASAHHWGRQIERLGHEVRLIAPADVKPFVKRQKNDMADAEAIAEATSRPAAGAVPSDTARLGRTEPAGDDPLREVRPASAAKPATVIRSLRDLDD